jgi:hypothetical protein|tara:strand:+ start:5217 stop:5492 length:276 start_codon:yes stop_codon:yes gene_type:complete
MMRTSRVLEFTFDPAKSLLGQGFYILDIAITEQLHKSSTEKFRRSTVPIPFQSMPIAFIDAKQTMQCLTVDQRLIRPFAPGGPHGIHTTAT